MRLKNFNLFHLYLALVSFISIIIVAVNLGIMITSLARFAIISDEEYIQNRGKYTIENCENPKNLPGKEESQPKTEEEIKKCKEEKRSDLIMSRNYELKDDLIKSIAWMIPFIILFAYHYRKFLNQK